MFCSTENGDIAVVIKLSKLGFSPPHHNGITRAQTDAHGGFERLRPALDRAYGSAGPIEGANPLSHFAAARKQDCWARRRHLYRFPSTTRVAVNFSGTRLS